MIIVQQCSVIGDGHYLEFAALLLDSCLCVFSVANLAPTTCSNSIIIADCKFQTYTLTYAHTCTHTHTHTHTLTHMHTHTCISDDASSSSSSSLGECTVSYLYTCCTFVAMVTGVG